MKVAVVQAPAKINLFLAIRGPRSDGYHELDMVNVEAGLADRLTFQDRPEPGIEITCDDPRVPVDSNNLVWRASALLLGESPVPGLSIHLEKRIPVGAGLGGGSSDAAATLRTLARLRRRGQQGNLGELAARIGSDVPYSLVGGLCRCRGRGEIVEPLLAADSSTRWLHALLILPPVTVNTVDAYQWWDAANVADRASPDRLIDAVRSRDPAQVSQGLHNTFDSVVPRFVPAVAGIRQIVRAETGREPQLCGSGASLFLVGGKREELEKVRETLRGSPELGKVRYEITPLVT